MDLTAIPQVKEWMFESRKFDPRNFVLENVTVAEAFSVLLIVWPSLVEYRDGVFLEVAFSSSNVDRWLEELEGDVRAVEGVVNHVHLWDVIEPRGEEESAALSAFAIQMAQVWRLRLKDEYPHRDFEVTVGDEPSDYGPTLTFSSR